MGRLLFCCVLAVGLSACQPGQEPSKEAVSPVSNAMGAGIQSGETQTRSKGDNLLHQARQAEKKGQLEKAIMLAKGASLLNSKPEANLILGRVYEKQGHAKLATKHYKLWLRASPKSADASAIKDRVNSLESSQGQQ